MFSPLLREAAIDYRAVGFFWGLLVLFLIPFVLKPLNLSALKPTLSIRNIILAIFLAFVPVSIVLVILNYLDYIPTTSPPAGIGPFLFVVCLSAFAKLLINWKHLSRSLQFVIGFEGAAFLAVLITSLIGIEFIGGRAFDLGLLVGSWATV